MGKAKKSSFFLLLVALALPSVLPAQDQPEPPARVELSVSPSTATVGQLIELGLTLHLPADVEFTPESLGTSLGPFTIVDGAWSGPTVEEQGIVWQWSGSVASYRTGELELPEIVLRVEGPQGKQSVSTSSYRVTVQSVLDPQEADAESAPTIADIKAPASIAPDRGPLLAALSILALLLLASLVVWWLQRRYASRLAAVPAPEDPFQRTPPHVWIYGELQKLLEQRLPEHGRIELFYAELARILKWYLSGRYRVGLMEQTSDEVPASLKQAAAPGRSISAVDQVLTECDQVKFAKLAPQATQWKAVVEEIYRIVDETKPVTPSERTAEREAG